jgi:hypothetical protein
MQILGLTEKIGYDRFAPNHGSPRPHIGKFYSIAGNHARRRRLFRQQLCRHLGMLRYCLIAAEAADNLGGKDAEALGYVNQIREKGRGTGMVLRLTSLLTQPVPMISPK